MEEVDAIIFHFLHDLDIQVPQDVRSLSDLPVDVIVTSAAKCLKCINPTLNVPNHLPAGISHRIEVAAQVASMCKDLGYKNDVGYQTFLYCNETDLRRVFMFLIENLPNEENENALPKISTLNKKSFLFQSISKKIEEDINTIWIPECCYTSRKPHAGDSIDPKEKIPNKNNLHMTEKQLIERLLNIQQFAKETQNQTVNQDVYKPNNVAFTKSLKELKESSIILRQELNTMESEHNVMEFEYAQAEKSRKNAESELNNVLEILKKIGLNHSDMESVNNIIEKVHKNIAKLHGKSEELTSKNLAIKLEIEKYRNVNTPPQSERSKCRNILISLKNTAKYIKGDYDEKEALKHQLKTKYEKLKAGNKRSMYTKRILEIISNVDKQNIEISKVLEDTRQLQKEINTLEGQLDRCFCIADETLFGDAKKDDQAKKAYKLLALLHSECNTIVNLINDTGILAREIVDLEDNIKAEKTKRTEDTLQRIQADISRIQDEGKA